MIRTVTPPRRQLYRSAKTTLRRLLRKRWPGVRGRLDTAIRAALRSASRTFLQKILSAPACAAFIASCILAASANAQQTIELADVASGNGGFAIHGATAGDDFGASVSRAGDVNGDGLADLLVGADRATPGGRTQAGQTCVIFGKTDGAPVAAAHVAAQDTEFPGDSGGFVINGAARYDLSGYTVAAAGDVNGDGLDDIIIGAPAADPKTNEGAGQAFVVFGKKDGTPVELNDVAFGLGGFAINGANAGDRAAQCVAGAGDVNGDGLADLLVGAPWVATDPFKTFAGQSYVIFGKKSGASVNLGSVAAGLGGGFAVSGINAFDESGFSVSSAGDQNGDGLQDLLIGARYGAYGDGHAYVVFGKPGAAPVNLSDIAQDDVAIEGDSGGYLVDGMNVSGAFGFSVSGPGDVNGDGIPDAIVGSPPTLLVYPSYGIGESYVIFGKGDGAPVDAGQIAAGTGPGFAINGANVHDFSGASVSGAGDFNGDGLVDVIVGSYRADPNGKNFAGQTHLVFGKSDGNAIELAMLDRSSGVTLNGEADGDISGFSVANAGDVNGDGFEDVIIGAPGAGDAGKAYVIFAAAGLRVYVDFNFSGAELGTWSNPYNSIAEAVAAAPRGGTIVCAPGTTGTTLTISKPLTLLNQSPPEGVVRIGGS